MFRSRTLQLEGDHLDVSFRASATWPRITPMTIGGHRIRVGDPDVGPSVNFGAFTPTPEEPLDWKHTVDPLHFHGTDQFRLLLQGAWITRSHPLSSGSFGFQEAGRVYQEHPGDGERMWLLLVYGDVRGEAATLTLEEDRRALGGDADAIAGSPVAGTTYRHPAGPRGDTAIATTLGAATPGYVWSTFSEADDWTHHGDTTTATAAGLWGDREAGPMVCLVKAGEGPVLPATQYATEVLVAVSGGSCRIGGARYEAGDVRVQRADTVMDPVIAGPDGVDLALLIADRRAATSARSPQPAGQWWTAYLGDALAMLAGQLVH